MESLPRGVARTPELTADDLFSVVSGYRLSAAIGAMMDLGVPDALADGAKTVDRVRRGRPNACRMDCAGRKGWSCDFRCHTARRRVRTHDERSNDPRTPVKEIIPTLADDTCATGGREERRVPPRARQPV